jgi:hypothetical protein
MSCSVPNAALRLPHEGELGVDAATVIMMQCWLLSVLTDFGQHFRTKKSVHHAEAEASTCAEL